MTKKIRPAMSGILNRGLCLAVAASRSAVSAVLVTSAECEDGQHD